MPVIQNLMKRWGFVKLSRYGLMLTPDGRILSLRPAVLDDGLGARIVGWEDGDLAAAELQKWEPARPAPAQAVAPRLAMPPRLPVRTTQPVAVAKPAPTPAPPVVIVPVAALVVKPTPAPVAPEPVVEEDDWEWTIAIARARAAADEVDDAARSIPKPLPASAMSGEWPKTETIGAIDYEDYGTVQKVRYAPPVEEPTRKVAIPAPRASTSPATVIPVPKLPSAGRSAREVTLRPVVRSPIAEPRRIAKGTNPIVDTQVTRMVEDTLTNVTSIGSAFPSGMLRAPAEPGLAIGDRTKPGITMPRAAAAVALPSAKRSASR